MKKDTTTIKRILRQTDNTNLHGYFQNEDNFIICNGYSIIKFDMNNIDFIADIDNLNNNTNKYYNYKSFNEHITKNQDARNTNGSQTIEILVEDLKMWKKHGKKGKPFIIATKKGFMGLNPCFLLDLASLTRQDKNKLIKIKVLDKKAPLYIDGNGVKAILCPIVLNKTDFNKNDYIAFLDKLADCYDLEKDAQKLKALEKANKPERNKKIKVSNMPIIVNNGVVCKDGYIYSDRNVDFFIYKNADNKTYTLYHLNSMLPCFTDCKSITAAIELIYDKLGEKSFIEKVIDIMQSNGAQERHDNAGATLATYGCLEDVKHFIDKMIDFKPTPAPNNDTTKEETPKTATIQDNAADIVADSDATATKTADNMSATETTTAATTDTANNDSVTDINNRTSETMQADARQTETTQDTPHKTSNTAVSLFVVTDKPQPVKLYGANIPTLERIPTYTQRIISRLQPLKSHRVYNTRVSNKKPLKKAYNDFVGTVSMSCNKCAMGGGMVAVNSS